MVSGVSVGGNLRRASALPPVRNLRGHFRKAQKQTGTHPHRSSLMGLSWWMASAFMDADAVLCVCCVAWGRAASRVPKRVSPPSCASLACVFGLRSSQAPHRRSGTPTRTDATSDSKRRRASRKLAPAVPVNGVVFRCTWSCRYSPRWCIANFAGE